MHDLHPPAAVAKAEEPEVLGSALAGDPAVQAHVSADERRKLPNHDSGGRHLPGLELSAQAHLAASAASPAAGGTGGVEKGGAPSGSRTRNLWFTRPLLFESGIWAEG